MSKRKVKPFTAHNYPRTHRGNPLPPPLGLYGADGRKAAFSGKKKNAVNPNIPAAVLANLILQAMELFSWAAVLWIIGDQLEGAGIVNSNLPFFDFFWMAGLVIFAVRFSKGINAALSRGARDTGLPE